MDRLGLLARTVAAAIGLSAVGALLSLVVGLLATPEYLLQSLVVFVLVLLVVGGLVRLGVRGAGETETTYW